MTTGKKIALSVGCGLPLICCMGGFFVFNASFGRAAGGLQVQLEGAKREGIPVTPEDLHRLVDFPESQNAAPIYRQAIALVEGDKSLDKDISAINTGMSYKVKPGAREAAVNALTHLAPVFALLEKATKLPHCNWDRDWSKGSMILFPELARMKGYAKILAFRAEIQSGKGDWQGALHSIAMAQTVGRHTGEDPILIGMLVHIACESIAFASFDRIIADRPENVRFVAAAQKVLDGFGPLPNFRRSLSGEVVMGRETIRHLRDMSELTGNSEEGNQSGNAIGRAVLSNPMVRDAFDAKFVEAYRELFRAVPEDGNQWETAMKGTTEVANKIDRDTSVTNTLNRILFPVFSQAAEAVGRVQMHRRLTGTGLRLLGEHARTGKFPTLLPDYGDLRMDPFSGDPLHYRVKGTGFLLYSVGVDRTDDDGKPLDRGHASENHDEVFTIRK